MHQLALPQSIFIPSNIDCVNIPATSNIDPPSTADSSQMAPADTNVVVNSEMLIENVQLHDVLQIVDEDESFDEPVTRRSKGEHYLPIHLFEGLPLQLMSLPRCSVVQNLHFP